MGNPSNIFGLLVDRINAYITHKHPHECCGTHAGLPWVQILLKDASCASFTVWEMVMTRKKANLRPTFPCSRKTPADVTAMVEWLRQPMQRLDQVRPKNHGAFSQVFRPGSPNLFKIGPIQGEFPFGGGDVIFTFWFLKGIDHYWTYFRIFQGARTQSLLGFRRFSRKKDPWKEWKWKVPLEMLLGWNHGDRSFFFAGEERRS